MFTTEPVSILIFIVAAILFSVSLVIFLGSKEYSSRAFSLFSGLVALWITFRGIYHTIPPQYADMATLMIDLSFATGVVLASVFLYFCLVFPENKRPRNSVVFLLIAINILLLPVYFYKDLFLGESVYIGGIQQWKWEQGPLLPIYDLFFAGLWIAGLATLFYKFKKYTGVIKKRLGFMFWVMLIGITPVEITSLLLPRFFNYFQADWISSITLLVWVSLLSYTIIKHN